MKSKLLTAIACAVFACSTAFAQTTVDGTYSASHDADENSLSGTTYSYKDAQGVIFSIPNVKDYVNSSVWGTNSIRLAQLTKKKDIEQRDSHKFCWSAPAGYVMEVNSITITTRVYSRGWYFGTTTHAYCAIGREATSSDTNVQHELGTLSGNDDITSDASSVFTYTDDQNGYTTFNYYTDHNVGTTTDAGSIYVDAITVDYTLYLILDENNTALNYSAGTHTVCLRRPVTAGVAAAVCFPFDYTPSNATVYEMTGQELNGDNITFKFGTTSTMTAGVPYILRSNQNIGDIRQKGVTLTTTVSPYSGSYANFTGSFVKGNISQNDIYLSNANSFKQLTAASATMKGFRSYITNVSAASNAAFQVDFDGTMTGIESVNGDILTDAAPIYNLAGQRVSLPSQPGVYVQNGHKFIIK